MNKINGVPIQTSTHAPIEYKTTRITYHNPIRTRKGIKRWNTQPKVYTKKEVKSYSAYMAFGKLMMHPDALNDLKKKTGIVNMDDNDCNVRSYRYDYPQMTIAREPIFERKSDYARSMFNIARPTFTGLGLAIV